MSDADPTPTDPTPVGDAGPTTACPHCGQHVSDGDAFCESCGAELAPAPAAAAPTGGGPPVVADAATPCRSCGGAIAGDGYCETCGTPAASARDHWVEEPSSWVAAVCDRGIRHDKNEDALAVAADAEPGGFAALVVCDGVTSAPKSEVASLAAAQAAREVLCSPGDGGEVFAAGGADRTTAPHGGAPLDGARPAPTGAEDLSVRITAWTGTIERATAAAHEAAAATALVGAPAGAVAPSRNPPSCTFVAAVVDGPLVVTGCVGDSRAYWLPDGGPAVQLSTDDSWAAEQMSRGVTREVAETGPHAHAITRWLGIDSPDPTPSLAHTTAAGPGWLLVCSDGLWNYCSDATDLAALVATTEKETGPRPVALAGGLVAWANGQGGHDNISVALARLGEPPAAPT